MGDHTTPPLPAHQTKHFHILRYPINHDLTLSLLQLDDGKANGTGLWLGAQCLSLFLANKLKRPLNSSVARPKVVELGSGIGLTALVLASLGWDVLATDTPNVIATVLSRNVLQNVAALPPDSGSIETRELDWTVKPEKWTWDDDKVIASAAREDSQAPTNSDLKLSLHQVDSSLQFPGPPFDLIVTSDTVYSPELARPLLRTIHALCDASRQRSAAHTRCPPVYLCIERRDPGLIDRTLAEAASVWGFSVVRIPHKKVTKAMEKGGVNWDGEDWEGIEIWKLTLVANAVLP